ncbi:hypothetical protein Atep_30000 (plasmid) [Allochromatium tepidum]|uniref:Uncharacterized protein n=1 Tax=Allochromatium tepidum TaxID=553982 RepID=A0ABM7QQ94_9GAMM|nr:hypothetical protein Atep_30000 [Allochromatium tepidum]
MVSEAQVSSMHLSLDYAVGDWCRHIRQASPCRVIDRQDVWGEVAYRVWLPAKDAVVRARGVDLAALESVRPSVEQILHTTAAAKLSPGCRRWPGRHDMARSSASTRR